MSHIKDASVNLVVTSPPYPMIEMWDEIMMEQEPKIRDAFEMQEYFKAYELMHVELDKIWKECDRVIKDGGMVCINIGDATRTMDKNFALYPNHARIIEAFLKLGFQNLPNIIWQKQTNAPNKFMGSGMFPPGAYVTLEHEYILVFRKGRRREFTTEIEKANRRTSAFFWEERNEWFSDMWEIRGAKQKLINKEIRDRSAAYPIDIPHRLINMFTVKGDLVLDPFMGTGTTTLAAMSCGRSSIGIEIDESLSKVIHQAILNAKDSLNQITESRLVQHQEFVKRRIADKGDGTFVHMNSYYNVPVVTRQEKLLQLSIIKEITASASGFEVVHE